MSDHVQVWVRVNAHVDEGVRELIEALSRFPRLRTIESCQGDGKGAYVAFYYGGDREDEWPALAELLLGKIGPTLARELGDLVHTSIYVTECGLVQGELTVRPGAMDDTVKLLHLLATEQVERTGVEPVETGSKVRHRRTCALPLPGFC